MIGCIAIGAGILMGVSETANYTVESGFAAFAFAAAIFMIAVVAKLAREFHETA
ncbi:MAG: hypothetical protein KGM42_05915 [Hyphomicrobiales bacterium]|nr:hypothetical protein [Hyphomicrobiales bacterium]